MKLDQLQTIISFAGIAFFAVALLIILLGKKVGAEGQPQRVVIGKYVDLRTNSVLMLAVITLLPACGPLALTYWKPDLRGYVAPDELSRSYLALKDLSLIVHGGVLIQNGGFADDVDITVARSTPGGRDTTLHYVTDEQGQFYIELLAPKPREQYAVTWSKAGYVKKTVRFGFNELPFPLVLQREDN